MSSSAPIRVAIQGELGSFSHEAALAMLPGAEIVPCRTAANVFDAILNKNVDVAVIPIENSLAGSVREFYDLFDDRRTNFGQLDERRRGKVKILRECMLRIQHNLIARPGTNLQNIKQVLSHQIALEQCRNFFAQNTHLQSIQHYDTAGSVKTIMENDDPSQAAIASKQAEKQYGGQILIEGIEDDPKNYTRFLLLQLDRVAWNQRGQEILLDETADKMSLLFSLKNRPGALVEALSIFSKLEMNLTKIESRPVKGRPWEYLFYVDVLFPKPEAAEEAMERLRPNCETIIDLGRYKAAVLS